MIFARGLSGDLLIRLSFWSTIGLAFLMRWIVFATAEVPDGLFHMPDSLEYNRIAWNLVSEGAYSQSVAPPLVPDLTRPPIFPIYLALWYWLVGPSPSLAAATQILLAVGTCALTYAFGTRFIGPFIGVLGAGLLTLDPLSIRYAALLLSETLFTFLLIGALFSLMTYFQAPRPGLAATAAALTGLAILCRPIAVLWPLALLPLFLLLALKEKQWRLMAHYILFVAVTFALVSIWVVRNERVGGLAVLSTVPGINLYYHRAAAVISEQEGISRSAAVALLEERLRLTIERDRLDFPRAYRLMEAWGQEILWSSPEIYLRLHFQGVWRMFAPHNPEKYLPGLSPTVTYWIESGFLVVLYAFAILGLFCGLVSTNHRLPFLLLAGTVLYFVALSGPEAYARFRVPIMPVLTMLAGQGFAVLFRRQGWSGGSNV
jgi:4-amino-4-deoxy-L-arabinose transferase-like glycosyltransferase